MNADPHFVCVMDSGPHWEARVLNLLRSLRLFGGALADGRFTVIAVGSVRAGFVEQVCELAGSVELSAAQIPTRPFMNKARALEREQNADLIVLDCDTVVIDDLTALPGLPTEVGAKPADADPFSRADWHTIERVCGSVGFGVMRTTTTGQMTAVYPNSGVLVVGREVRAVLRESWLSKFPLADFAASQVLPAKQFYAEQVALGAAIVGSSIPIRFLGVEFNWPAHLEPCIEGDDAPAPRLIHYHNMCAGPRVLAPLAPGWVQERLDRLAAESAEPLGAPGRDGAKSVAQVLDATGRVRHRARTGQR